MWLVYAILTALIWGTAELFYKKGARSNEKYSHLKISVCVGLVMGIHAVYTLLTEDVNYNAMNMITYLPVSMMYILSMTFSYFGMSFLAESISMPSISDPIENTAGAITAIMCFFILKQTMSPIALISVILIIIGVVSIGFLEAKDVNGRKKELGKKLAIISFCMPFLYALLDATGSFLDAYFLELETTPLLNVSEANIELVANVSYELTFFIVAMILLLFIKLKKEKLEITKQKDKLIAAVLETAGQFTYVFAMSGKAIIAAPIVSSVCIVSVILSRIFLKEKLTKKQYVAIGIVILGILMLSVTDV